MSYQVLARKWRPRTFKEMVGQEHVLRALINALDNDRLHHAFLFTGTRGVGKTTIARILAKSLNCEAGVSSTPCCECSACREIDEGRFIDLVEVDAASRTRVEETRELLENVQYTPARGRYKVYLVDEVHMFSKHSFNALLKTLEEPPPHVKFLLATTDPQKLPVTILSRCLQFNLKRLPQLQIRDYLAHILDKEGVEAEESALAPIARAADGSMRDALSLLDQAIAYGGGRLTESDVRSMLGVIDNKYIYDIIDALAAMDASSLITQVRQLAERATDFAGVLAELLTVLQRIALAQTVPEAIDDQEGDKARITALANALSPENTQLYYQTGLIGRRDLDLAPTPQGGFEMILLRMLAFTPAIAGAVRATPQGNQEPDKSEQAQPDAADKKYQSMASATPVKASSTDAQPGSKWTDIVSTLDLSGLERQLAVNCVLKDHKENNFTLLLSPILANLHNSKMEVRISEALEKHFSTPVNLTIEIGESAAESPAESEARIKDDNQRAAVESIKNDDIVKSMCETFGGDVIQDSIQSVD